MVAYMNIHKSMIYTFTSGYDRLAADIKLMIGVRIGWYWKITWKYISPITLGVSKHSTRWHMCPFVSVLSTRWRD